MTPNNNLLFQSDPLADLLRLIQMAQTQRARRLLILSGKPVALRIGHDLSKITDYALHFNQTESLAKALLSPSQIQDLDKDGAVEFDFPIDQISNSNGSSLESGSAGQVRINIFYGEGAHNVIVFMGVE